MDESLKIPVVGGHAGASILPLLSQATPSVKDKLTDEQVEALTVRIQNGGTEVVMAKAGAGSATLSMAKAGAQFAISLIKAQNGEKGIVECAYVESDVVPECQWFATQVEIGPNGIEKNLGLGELDTFEKQKPPRPSRNSCRPSRRGRVRGQHGREEGGLNETQQQQQQQHGKIQGSNKNSARAPIALCAEWKCSPDEERKGAVPVPGWQKHQQVTLCCATMMEALGGKKLEAIEQITLLCILRPRFLSRGFLLGLVVAIDLTSCHAYSGGPSDQRNNKIK